MCVDQVYYGHAYRPGIIKARNNTLFHIDQYLAYIDFYAVNDHRRTTEPRRLALMRRDQKVTLTLIEREVSTCARIIYHEFAVTGSRSAPIVIVP